MKNTTKCFIFIFFAVFTFISIIAVWPDRGKDHNSGFTSAELELEEKTEKDSTTDSSITTYTFVNEAEEMTCAIDRGYAVMKQLKNAEGQVTEERYFDADGNPVKLYDSYYGVECEYHDHEAIIRYLDSEGNTMPLATYSTIVRTLDDAGRAVDDYYYDLDMQPVQWSGYYGIHRDYDGNGWNNRITYLDRNGQPVLCSSGYAINEYKRDEEGNVTGEFYLDTQGNPTKSSLGEYGQLYERDENGRINQITYLDSDGNAKTNSAGYTILKRTYYRDGNINTDGISMGSVQIPLKGQPIIMLADRQSTGGYPKIGTVITVDFTKIAQARPGQKIRFIEVSLDLAQDLYIRELNDMKALDEKLNSDC